MGGNESKPSQNGEWTPEMIQQYNIMQKQQQQIQRQQQIIAQQQRQQQILAQQNKKLTSISNSSPSLSNNYDTLLNGGNSLYTQQQFMMQQQNMRNTIRSQQEQALMDQHNFNQQHISSRRPNNEFQPRMRPSMHNNGELVTTESSLEKFENDERRREEEFERQEKIRKQKFMEEQRKRRNAFSKEMNEFKNSNFDPYKILSLTKDYTIPQLKKAYKILAMKTHPDKGGDPRVFKVVTKSYMFLLNEYKKKNQSHSYEDLMSGSKKYMESQATEGGGIAMTTDGNFNVKMFNKIYSENRLSSVDDDGYGNWMKSSELDEDYEPENLFSDQFNISVFNNMFKKSQKSKMRKQRSLVEYKEPTALNSANQVACVELGRAKITDFSSSSVSAVQSTRKKLQFTDYKKAHTETTFTDRCGKPQRGEFKSIGDLKMNRKTVKYTMTPQQKAKYEKAKRLHARQEAERIKRLERRDNSIFANYNKINNLITGGNLNTNGGSNYKQIEYRR